MRRILTNSTALVACLSLSLPLPVAAQQESQAEEPELCADGSEAPCDAPEAAPAAEEAASPEEAEVAEEPAEAPEVTEEPAEAVEGTAPEAAVEPEEQAEPEAETAAEPDAVEPDSAEPAEAVEGTAPEAAVEPEEQAEPEAETAPEPEAVEPDSAEAAVEPEKTAEPEADSAAEVAPESQPQDPSAETAQESDAVDTRQGEAAEEGTASAEPATATEKTAEESVAAETTAADEAAQAAQSAAAATAGADVEAEVTEERVTEESSRSSDENFMSRMTDATGLDDEDTRSALLAGVLGALGGYTASQLLGDRQVVASSQDRVVVQRPNGEYQLLKDDNALLRQPGTNVRTETFNDGSTRTTVLREDGSRIVTIRDADLRVVRRTKLTADGQEWVLIDDTAGTQAIDVTSLPQPATQSDAALTDEEALRRALEAAQQPDRRYSLAQVREVRAVREMAPAIQLDNLTFETGSAAISPSQAEQLNELGQLLSRMIEENPREIFLVEGHTDAVGDAAMNLALSDRRAESVALALTEYFDVPPENLVVQGYGERYLRVQTDEAERLNRRAGVRRITQLLQVASAN